MITYDMIVKFKNVAYKKMLSDIYREKFSQMFEYFHESRFSSNGPKEQYVFLGPVSRSRSPMTAIKTAGVFGTTNAPFKWTTTNCNHVRGVVQLRRV